MREIKGRISEQGSKGKGRSSFSFSIAASETRAGGFALPEKVFDSCRQPVRESGDPKSGLKLEEV